MKRFAKQLLIGAISLGMLTSVSAPILFEQHAHAMPRTYTRYWNRTRRVKVRHGFRAYEIHDVTPEYKSKAVRSKWIHAGRKIYVYRRGVEWMWTLGGYGLYHHNNYYWVFDGDDTYPHHFERI